MTRYLTPEDLTDETTVMSRDEALRLANADPDRTVTADEVTADNLAERIRLAVESEDEREGAHAEVDRRRRATGAPIRAMLFVVGIAVSFALGGICAVDHCAKTQSGVRR